MTVAGEVAQGEVLWDALGGHLHVTSFRFGCALDVTGTGVWERLGLSVVLSEGPWALTLKRSPAPGQGGAKLHRIRPGAHLYLATVPNLVTVPAELTYEPVSHVTLRVGTVSAQPEEIWQPKAGRDGWKPPGVTLEVCRVGGLQVLPDSRPDVLWGSQGHQTPRRIVSIRDQSGRPRSG